MLVSERFGRFRTRLKRDRLRAYLQRFHSLRGKVLLRLEQWTTGVAIMAIMSMFAQKNPGGNEHVSRYFQLQRL